MLVLLVDDEPMVRRALRRLLETEGHIVREARSALEALTLLKTHDFDLGLIDWELGTTLTGLDVADHCPRRMALIMVTGHTVEEMEPVLERRLARFRAIVGKPIEWGEDLLPKIQHVARSIEDTKP